MVSRNSDWWNKELTKATRDDDHRKVVEALKKGAHPDGGLLPLTGGQTALVRTPLQLAICYGQPKTVKMLCEAGATVNAVNKLREDMTALHMATEDRRRETMQILLQFGADVNATDRKGRRPLHLAVESGRLELVCLLLDHHAELDVLDHSGQTPACLAAKAGHTNILDKLHQHGCDLTSVDDDGTSLMHLAAEAGHKATCNLLVDKKVPHAEKNKYGFTPANLAARNKYHEISSFLSHINGPEAIMKPHVNDVEKNIAIIYARRGKLQLLKLLLDEDPQSANKTSNTTHDNGQTPLHAAAAKGHNDIIKLLIQKDAKVNAKDINGDTPLHLAAHYGHTSTVQLLLHSGANEGVENNKGQQPAHKAAAADHTQVMQLLEDRTAHLMDWDNGDASPVDMTNKNIQEEPVQWLTDQASTSKSEGIGTGPKPRPSLARYHSNQSLEDPGTKNTKDKAGTSSSSSTFPITPAAWENPNNKSKKTTSESPITARSLYPSVAGLESFTKSTSIAPEQSFSPKTFPANSVKASSTIGNRESYQAVLPEPTSKRNNVADKQLLKAAAEGNLQEVHRLKQASYNLEVTSTSPGKEGLHPLHLACLHGHKAVVKQLLHLGADPQGATDTGRHAVHFAAYGGHVTVLELLSDARANLGQPDHSGTTSLHLAAENGELDAARWLVQQGVDIQEKNKFGRTAADLATESGHSKIAQYLKSQLSGIKLLEAAAVGNWVRVVQLLHDDADVNQPSHKKETLGWRPLHLAADGGHTEVVYTLLRADANQELTDKKGMMAVHLAVQGGHLETARPLISGTDRHLMVDGKNLVHWAAVGGHKDMLKYLDQNGFSMKSLTNDQKTSLQLAADHGNLQAVQYLVGRSVFPGHKDRKGLTALDYAIQEGHKDVANFLQRYVPHQVKAQRSPSASCIQHSTSRSAHHSISEQTQKPQGLYSLGNTCYMSAIIQCLYNTSLLTSYFIEPTWRQDLASSTSDRCVAEVFGELIQALNQKGDIRLAMRKFKQVVGDYDGMFVGNDQQEAHDFLSMLLEALDADLKCSENESYINKTFFGEHTYEILCLKRKVSLLRVKEPFSSLTIPVAVRSRMETKLEDLLELYYNAQEIMWDCIACGTSHLCTRTTKITKLPDILILHLSRFSKQSIKGQKSVITFPHDLTTLHNYQEQKNRKTKYMVYGVCYHQGTMTSGHYTASCRDWVNRNIWYNFDDEYVTKVAQPQVSGAHILFYENITQD